MTATQQTLDLIEATGSDNIIVQYDIYHMQIMEDDLAPKMKKNLAQINYPFLFNYLDEIGYKGWIGYEYKPATTTNNGLG